MLTVDTTSWHYRIYAHWRNRIARHPPRTIDLCHYMRAVMLYVPLYYLAFGAMIVFGAIAFVVLAPIWVPAWLLAHGRAWPKRLARWIDNHGDWIGGGLAVLGVGALVLGLVQVSLEKGWWYGPMLLGGIAFGVLLLIGLVISLAEFLDGRADRRRRKATGAPKQKRPSLTWAWVKAKKRKVCPLIQVQNSP